MAHMVTVAASIKRRVHYHRVERCVMGRVQCEKIALDRIGKAVDYASFVGEAGLQLHARYIGTSVPRGRSKRGLSRARPQKGLAGAASRLFIGLGGTTPGSAEH